jgi:hypothetical protein
MGLGGMRTHLLEQLLVVIGLEVAVAHGAVNLSRQGFLLSVRQLLLGSDVQHCSCRLVAAGPRISSASSAERILVDCQC